MILKSVNVKSDAELLDSSKSLVSIWSLISKEVLVVSAPTMISPESAVPVVAKKTTGETAKRLGRLKRALSQRRS